MTLIIRNHRELQAAVVRTIAAGATWGLLEWRFASPLAHAVGMTLVGLAAVPPRSWRSAATASSLGALAAAATLLPARVAAPSVFLLLGLLFARDLFDWPRRALAAAVGATSVALGCWVASELAARGALALDVAPGLLALGVGVVRGLFGGLAVVARQIETSERGATAALREGGDDDQAVAFEEVGRARAVAAVVLVHGSAPDGAPASQELPLAVDGELATLLERAGRAYADARRALGAGPSDAAAAASDLHAKIERFGRRWGVLGRELGRTDRSVLDARLNALRARESGSQDEVTRAEYASARASLERQLEYVVEIDRGLERAVARLHHHVAVLERLSFAALHHRAVAAGRAGEDLAPLVEDLVAAGRDLDCASEALAELPA